MEEQDVAPTVVLAPPTEKKIRMKSPSPGFRGRSQTPIRGRSMTPLMRFREKSATPMDPMTWRSITPFIQREEVEKTPFEIGSNILLNLASYKAIIDKALVMDISAEEEPLAKYIISEHSVIDRAAVMDISNVEIIYVEDDFVEECDELSDASSVRESESRESSVMDERPSEEREDKPEEEEVSDKKKKKEKKVKKAPKKKEKKEKEPSPPKLKLDLGGPPPPKVNKAKLFEQQQKAAAEAPLNKPPPKKSGKLAGALAAMQQQEAAAKEAELQRQQIEEKMKQMKEEQASKQQNGDQEEDEGEGDAEERGSQMDSEYRSRSGSGSRSGSEYAGSNADEQEDEENNEEAEGEEDGEGSGAETESSVENFTRPDNDYGEWDKYDDQQGVIRSKYERKKHKKMSERERDIEWQKAREAARYPRIHAHLKDCAIEEGHSIKLTCTVSGPELNIKWLKDGHPLEKSPKYRILVNEGIVSLEILRTLPSDSGEYTCALSNNNGDASTTAIVTIYDVIKDDPTPPTFTLVRDYYHLNEDVLGIEVHCTGTPRPKITWIRDMVEVIPSYKHTLLEEAHGVYKLEIYKPSFKDNGRYSCRAENVMAEEEITHNVSFIKPKHFHIRGIQHAHSELMKEKEEAAKRAMEEALKAKEEYEMRRTGKLPPRSRAEPEQPCSQKDRLKFATQLRDRTAIVGNKVKFTVSVIGPDPNIRWFKDGNPIVYGPSIRNSTADGMSILEMTHLTADQTGEYRCQARNDHSEVSTSCYLKIYDAKAAGDKEAPLFVLSMRDVYHTQENDLVIDCKVRGNPRPIIFWQKDELPIEFDERTQQIEHGDGLCELIINKPTTKDSGNYACTATNAIGNQKIVHKVEFTPQPSSRRDSGMPSETASESGKGKTDATGAAAGVESGAENSATQAGKGKRPPRPKSEPAPEETMSRRSAGPTFEELQKAARNKLSFVTHLTNRVFAEGSKVKLSCVVQGPDPNVRWLKDENPVVYSPRVKNLSRDGMCALEIDKCTPEDSGDYKLIVRNQDSDISSSCTLEVYAVSQTSDFAPTFTRAPKHTYHLNTNEIYLETRVRGQPMPKVEWVKDGVTIAKEDEKYKQIDHADGTCELIVNFPKPNDSGKYVCKAYNRAGECSVQHTVLFEGKAAHIIDNRHRVYHSDPEHLAKAKSEFPEKAHENGVNEPKPDPEEEEKGKKGRGRGSKGTGSAQNTRTESTPVPEPTPVVTRQKEPPRESKKTIYFASKLSDRVVAEGSKVKLTCYLDGSDPSIRWFKDEQPVVYSPKCRQANTNGVCVLEFTAVAESDSGVYRCYARNTTGEVSTTAKLEVFPNPGSPDSEPTFTRSIKDTYHTQLNEIKLSCHCRGFPTPAITWVKGGVVIEPSEKYQLEDKEDGTCELTINYPNKQDNGKYVLQGENRAGKAEISHLVQLQLKDAPRLPPPHPTASAEAETNGTNGVEDDTNLPPKGGRKKGKGERESVASTTVSDRNWVSRYQETPIDPKTKLHFAAFLTDRTIAEGGKTKLSAYVEGPDPNIRWLKDENPVVLSSNCRSQLRDGLVTLDMAQLKPEDSGVYKLICRNQSGEISCSCKLMVYEVVKEDLVAPLFSVPIKDSYHAHSNQLILECKVHGEPNPTIDWYKNGVKLTKNEHYSFKENVDGVRQLIISDPTRSDNGSYRCEASNSTKITEISKIVDISDRMKNGSEELIGLKKKIRESKQESEEAKLEFRQKLIFESFLKNVTVSEGNSAKFICSVRGPDADVVWLKDSVPIRRNSRYLTSVNDGLVILEIPEAQPSDSGEYTCLVKNSKSEITTTAKLNVYDRTNEKLNVPPSFSRSLRESYDSATNELILDCIVRGHPKIHWFKDNYNISSNRYTAIEEIGGIRRLIIKDPVLTDLGCFTCRAEENNQIDEVSLRVSNVDYITPTKPKDQSIGRYSDRQRSRSRIQDRKSMSIYSDETLHRDAKKKPIFSTELMDRTAAENSTIKLTCNIIGIDTTVRWFRNSLPMDPSARYQTRFEDGLATLEIFSARPDDSAEYTCVARNQFGELSSSGYLKVYQGYELSSKAPIFTRPMKDTYNLNSDELILECRVRGSKPSITWTKNNEFIESNDKYQQFDQADGYCKLIINNPEEKDSGLYSCKAENSMSSDKVTHNVVFNGRDAYILEKTHGYFHRDINKPHFQNSIGDHMITQGGVIALQADILHGPVDVQWYRDHSQIVPGDKVRAFQDHGIHTLIIPDAKYEVSGTYTCVASNAFGKVESVGHVHIVGPSVKGGKCPLFQSRPETEMLIMTGDPFSFSFRLIGEPKPKLIFMKGLKDITQSDRVLKETQDDYIRFTVQRSTPMDSGTYWIVARNEHGTDRAFVTITVKQRARSITPSYSSLSCPIDDFADISYLKNPPDPISSEPICVDSGRNHISLSWGKSHKINSAPVLAYKVEAWMIGIDGGARWQELGITPINSFDAFNLRSGCEYHFRVTPKNRYGWGKSTQTSSAILMGGAQCLPEFTKILPGQLKALSGMDFTLECSVKGTPKPEICWYRDGVQIRQNDQVSVRSFGSICRLTIKAITDRYSGRYTCEATNCQGRVSTFARLQVVTDPRIYAADSNLKRNIDSDLGTLGDMIPQFTMRLRERRIQVTYPVRLTCQAVGWPSPLITWFKDGAEIEQTDRVKMFNDGQFNTLEISKTTLSDTGIYTASAKNESGEVSCHCNLYVDKGIRGYIAPEFYCTFDPIYRVKSGNEIRISGQIEAYPTVGVTWQRNGIRLRPSRRLTVTLDQEGYVELVIADASQWDAGVYTCIASNAVGLVESNCRVIVDELDEENKIKVPDIRMNVPYSKEPMFVTKPRSTQAFEGDTVIIYCEVIGDPKPDVVWLRDFLKPDYYKDAPHFRRIGDGPEYRLEIPHAKLDFTGTYSVIATNCYGEAKAIISLQIYAKDLNKSNAMNRGGSIKHGNVETLPIFTRPLKDLRCCDGDSITLECHVEGQPEPTVIWEKDGRILPHSNDFRTNFCDDRATLSISRVFPEDEGEYTCVASNNIGKSYTSACIIVDVPEEKENLISRILTRPSGLLSTNSTPRSTPRTTPVRSISPMPLSYRSTRIDLSSKQHKCAAPKFYAMPHNRLAEEGETVRFQCAIAGHPVPWSTWDKDGVIVTPTTRINIKERDDLRILEIEEVTMEDAGLYRITLENEYGRIEATARLDIIANKRSSSHGIRTSASPRRSISSSRRIMGNSTRIGGRLALACNFRGGSVPNKKFYHNGTELPPTDRVKTMENDETSCLIIDNIQAEDEGVYTCIANNELGIAATSTIVTFNDTHERTAPEFVRGLGQTIRAKESYVLDLTCSVVCSDPFEMTWLRDGDVIPDSDDFRYIDHGDGLISLRILDPFVYDSGRYTCTVCSDYGKCETSCDVIIYEVSEQDEFETKPVFIKCPQTVVAAYGAVVSFCARVSPVHAKVKWSICGRAVTEDTRGILIEHQPDGVHILHVLGLEYRHSGEIKCVAYIPTHPDPVETTVFTDLVVLPTSSPTVSLETNPSEQPEIPAYIIRGPEDCSVLIGGTVTLEAIFGGYSQPKVKWYRAGRQITESTNIKIQTSPGYSSLILTDITADQSGKYSIEIMNEHSCDISSASVSVEGPPDPPGSRPIISQGSDRLSVAWCGPPFDGGVMITGFILEIQEENNDWIEYSTVVDSLATTIKDLKPGVTYRFRVRAENAHGRSAPSVESEEVRISLGNEVQSVFDEEEDIIVKPGGDFKTRFLLQEELGKGRFGVVHKVVEIETNRTLAAKIVKCIKAVDKQKIQEEISIMQSLRHPKLLQLAAAFENPREMIMVMEYITGGELFERVVADDFTLTERDCILFLRQICEGVDYMHKKSVVHLDLKPENIMCHNRTSHQIKIIDFGLAQRISSDTPVRVLFGTPEFIPPEIINYEPIGFQSDMWSIGVICYVLLSGLSPFMGESDVDTFSNITCADFDFDDDSFDAVSQDAKDFISSLLVHRKEKRLTAKQCLESKWLSDKNANLSTAKICTDKLKKFVIRRKWQKTGNAIRALGRMATLSANSRRNSAASASVPSSPRPSITGTITSSAIQHMTSLNEEEDSPIETIETKNPTNPIAADMKSKNKTCNERSDSGFSECSNCSEKIPCVCSHQTIDKNLIITEEQHVDEEDDEENGKVDIQLSHEILQLKLEEIADVHTDDDQGTTDSHSSSIASIPTSSTSRNGSDTPETRHPYMIGHSDIKISVTSETPTKQNLSRSSSVDVATSPVDKGPIMRSDFTNTINMRKQWLEQNAQKEKPAIGPVTRTLIEGSGKVSMLKQRFSLEKIDSGNKKSDNAVSTVSTFVRSNQSSMTTADNKRALDGLSNSLTDHSNSTKLNLDERNSYAKSIETRSPLRLDGRVKEVSTRLTATPTSNNDTIKRNGGGRSPNGNNNNESFKKAAAFWKG